MPADNPPREIYLKSEKGEIEVFICPEQKTPSPNSMVPPSPKVTPQTADKQTAKPFGSAQRNLIKSFDTAAVEPTDLALLDDVESPFVNYQLDNFISSVKAKKCDESTTSSLSTSNCNKVSPQQMARNAVQPHSYNQEQKSGVRNSLMGGEINTLSPFYLTQNEYSDGN